MRAYPAYKKSALKWLGQIPENWEEKKAKWFLREVDERSEGGAEELLSVSHITGVTPRSEKDINMFLAESYEGYKLCNPDDLVINTMWAWMGAMGISKHRGIVSSSYGVYRQRKDHFLPGYLDYLSRLPGFVYEYGRRSKGITSSRARMYPEDFFEVPLFCPPIHVQQGILRTLNSCQERIREFIAKKKQEIGLLKEHRAASITQLVTRGLNPTGPTKPSNIFWLPRVPTNWRTRRIKHEFLCLDHKRVPLSASEREKLKGDYDYYGASGVIDRVDRYLFDDELLLLAEDGANLTLRNLPLALVARGKFWVNNHAHVLKPRTGNITYLAALLESIDYSPWVTGAAQPKLTQDRLLAVELPVPLRKEQDQIAASIREIDTQTTSLQTSAEHQITKMEEYRTALISAAVTGKIDVRNT